MGKELLANISCIAWLQTCKTLPRPPQKGEENNLGQSLNTGFAEQQLDVLCCIDPVQILKTWHAWRTVHFNRSYKSDANQRLNFQHLKYQNLKSRVNNKSAVWQWERIFMKFFQMRNPATLVLKGAQAFQQGRMYCH